MSVQFGRWNFGGQPASPDYIDKINATLAPYGPDSNESYSERGIRILYRAFHTTKESHREKQPWICPSGAVITWDGRLDNRADLVSELRNFSTVNSTDVAIVAATYEKWGTNCLGKLIGDWAMSIWNPRENSVLLAKDSIGTKHIYYSFDDTKLSWSTILDPLVLYAGRTFEICEEYIAGWFSYFPAAHLTPYVGVHAVPPSSSVFLRPGKHTVSKYWDFDPAKRIRYRTDGEYEECFRTCLARAVLRRLRSDRPVLAELSGGMDSSAIVCMADTVIAQGVAETTRLDTISWYDDSYDHTEPDWNERNYFAKVEEKRGRTGCHVNLGGQEHKSVGSQRSFQTDFGSDRFAATPFPRNHDVPLFRQYAAFMKSRGHRVALSGIGGGDVTGDGVPTPTPELQNLLVRARFFALIHQVNAWAKKTRKNSLLLLREAVGGFLPRALVGVPKERRPASWLNPGFVHRNHAALCGYPWRVKLFGPLPSFQDNIAALGDIRRLLMFFGVQLEPFRDLRFPYLDRDLLEFIYAVPREQIVRMGQRRSLMKRALVGIVPDELLNRRRRAFIPPVPSKSSSTEWLRLTKVGKHMTSSSIGIINQRRLAEALQNAQDNQDAPIGILSHTLRLESWLHHLTVHGILADSMSTNKESHSSGSHT